MRPAFRTEPTCCHFFAWLALCSLGADAQEAKQGPTDAEIRELLIQASMAAYKGACPCPESLNARNSAAEDSAYSRDGGNRPLCYPQDVKDEMIKRYREQLAKP